MVFSHILFIFPYYVFSKYLTSEIKMSDKRWIQTDLDILEALAEKGDASQYEVTKIIDKDYHTVFEHFKKLKMEKHKYIQQIRTEASEKGGKDKHIYSLTIEGLLFYLIFRGVNNKIEKIAYNQKSLWSLVFGKWEHICKTGNKERAIKNLRDVFESFRSFARIQEFMTQNTRNLINEVQNKADPLDYFTLSFYTKNIDEDLKDDKWIKMIAEDKEIQKYIRLKVNLLEKNAVEQLEYITRIKNQLDAIQNK